MCCLYDIVFCVKQKRQLTSFYSRSTVPVFSGTQALVLLMAIVLALVCTILFDKQ